MFEILSSMIKEMKNLRESILTIQSTQSQVFSQSNPSSEEGSTFRGIFPPDLMRLFQGGPQMFPSTESRFDDEEEDEYKKIVVSDTELDSDDDDEDESNVKIISVDIGENQIETVSLADLEEEENIVDQLDIDETNTQNEIDEIDENVNKIESSSTDYKKMDISYLRTMVITRGLATDTKKLKKQDLIKLLEQSNE
jgi:hypothetical protein